MSNVNAPTIRVFIQARMSSSRFPGKVLAPFRQEPIILHVIRAVNRVADIERIVVTTSVEASDDPLAAYLEKRGFSVFRGPLLNVFERFRLCLVKFPAEWILRISADSPLLELGALEEIVAQADTECCDLVTTVFPRSFPKGTNAELIRARTFESVPMSDLSAEDREHVTSIFYRNADRFRIVNVSSGKPELAKVSLAVDSVEDLRRLENLSTAELAKFSFSGNARRRIP